MEDRVLQWSLQLFDPEIELQEVAFEEQKRQLIQIIAHLIDRDYHRLTHILYRIDVDENKLKQALMESDRPIAELIAELIIERQRQKLKYREMYKNRHL